MSSEKVLLAYSGGLDTSCILKWLLNKNYNVICFMANIGQNEDFIEAEQKALKIGASQVIIKDLQDDFVTNYIWPSIQMGLIYEERYLLGTSLARPCITTSLIQTAKEIGATAIAHGATSKGNDQIRFELSAMALNPNIKIIAPWRLDEFLQQFQGRSDLLNYAELNSIPLNITPKSPWSIDSNIMHISYESGILENPYQSPPANLYQLTKDPLGAPLIPYQIIIEFQNGLPNLVHDLQLNNIYKLPISILKFLNQLGSTYGIGRIDIVENRYIGMKSRGIYETPGCQILYEAHRDLNIFHLDREIYRIYRYLCNQMSDLVYNGYWYSPESQYLRQCLDISQKHINGRVMLIVLPGHIQIIGRETINEQQSLYNQELVSMEQHQNYNPQDANGFIAIQALRIKQYCQTYGNYK